MKRWIGILLLLMGITWGVMAEGEPTPPLTPERIEITAEDGQVLVGDVYLPSEVTEEGAPALLLMHQNRARRSTWEPLIPSLVEAGYVVLTVDLRGHGETGGRMDAAALQTDTQAWLTYLASHEAVDESRLATIGASVGGNLALVGCAANEGCQTAIALSPGLDFFTIKPEEAVTDGLARRSALLISSRSDSESASAVRQMAGNSRGMIGLRVYGGFAHGTELFDDYLDSLKSLILTWLSDSL